MLEHIEKDEFTVKEAFYILKELKMTKNEQIVRRWVRGEVKGKELKSTPPPKGSAKIGHRIKKEDLEDFIQKHLKTEVPSFLQPIQDKKVNQLQESINQLKKENDSLKKEANKKSNGKGIKKEENLSKLVTKKYEESLQDFNKITEDDYQRLIESMSFLYVENQENKSLIKELEEKNNELMLLADQIRPTVEQRKVLKGLGVSIYDIMSHCSSPKNESVYRLNVEYVGVDEITVTFDYGKGKVRDRYVGIISTRYPSYSSKSLTHWMLGRVKKISSKRDMPTTKISLIEYDVLSTTFNLLYEQETRENQPFHYLFR